MIEANQHIAKPHFIIVTGPQPTGGQNAVVALPEILNKTFRFDKTFCSRFHVKFKPKFFKAVLLSTFGFVLHRQIWDEPSVVKCPRPGFLNLGC